MDDRSLDERTHLVRRRRATPNRARRGHRRRSPARRRRERSSPGPRLQPEIAGAKGPETDDSAFDPLFGSLGEIDQQELVGEPGGPAAREVAETAPSTAREAVKAHEGGSWLATALADLERAWGAPLPELARTVGLHGGARAPERPSAAAPSSVAVGVTAAEGGTSRGGGDDVFDEQAASPWASWTDEDVVGPEPRSARGGDRHGDAAASSDGDGAEGVTRT